MAGMYGTGFSAFRVRPCQSVSRSSRTLATCAVNIGDASSTADLPTASTGLYLPTNSVLSLISSVISTERVGAPLTCTRPSTISRSSGEASSSSVAISKS